MNFKIVSTGWECVEFLEQTLASIEIQSVPDFEIFIVYDPSEDNGAELIRNWCDSHDGRWRYRINTERKFAPRNQWEAIQELAPADDDVVVFLDLDGDRFAHRDVLAHLRDYYGDRTLLTYGSYQPIPDKGDCLPAIPFPAHIVERHAYREAVLTLGPHFNHLRTMRGVIAKAIPKGLLQWPDGRWYEGGTDYEFTVAGLELAGGRYKCIPETLMFYNHANPRADDQMHPAESTQCIVDFLGRPPLLPLNVELPADGRIDVLRDYGIRYGLNIFIETGTLTGDTPWALQSDFKQLYTIELEPNWYNNAVSRFSGTNVIPLHGDSVDILPRILSEIDQPALVWLDAHYSGGNTAQGRTGPTPIRDELHVLFSDSQRHLILVDDARLFDGGWEHSLRPDYLEYPSLRWIKELAESHGYRYELADDIIRLIPQELS